MVNKFTCKKLQVGGGGKRAESYYLRFSNDFDGKYAEWPALFLFPLLKRPLTHEQFSGKFLIVICNLTRDWEN